MTERIDTSELPELLREFVDEIGLDRTLRIVRRWGGLRLYIPSRVPDGNALAREIGTAAAERLAARYGPDTIPIPFGADALRQARDRAIVQRYLDGEPASRLASEHGTTERTVRSCQRMS